MAPILGVINSTASHPELSRMARNKAMATAACAAVGMDSPASQDGSSESEDAIFTSPFFVALACTQDEKFFRRVSGGSAKRLRLDRDLNTHQ